MKITVRQLKKLIKEQVEEVQDQGDWDTIIDRVIKNATKIKNYNHYIVPPNGSGPGAGAGMPFIENMPLELFAYLGGITVDRVRKMQDEDNDSEEQLAIESTVTVYAAED